MLGFVLFASYLTIALAQIQLSPSEEKNARLAKENPNLFEGDILGIDLDNDRNTNINDWWKWPNAVVPYKIDDSLAEHKKLILEAMEHYHETTCIRFVERTKEQNYINIFKGTGCYSHVGDIDSYGQDLSLGKGCWYKGTVIHELGHAIGFYHEHSRWDRDDYLDIFLENVDEDNQRQFDKRTKEWNVLINEFDYDSIMLYGETSFSKNGKPTMLAKNRKPIPDDFYKHSMSKSDIYRVNFVYNCTAYL